jgi:hypothetical protein
VGLFLFAQRSKFFLLEFFFAFNVFQMLETCSARQASENWGEILTVLLGIKDTYAY